MAIETECSGCKLKLRVSDEFAGQNARCPACNVIFQVPSSSQPIEPRSQWWLKTPEGKIYGTVEQAELDRWVAEGRITPECHLSLDYGQNWIPASQEYPVLSPIAVEELRRGSPFLMVSPNKAIPEASPPQVANPLATELEIALPKRARYVGPHRGGLILALGICSWMLCPPIGFIAWTLGSQDLMEMRDGNMDPGGETLTRAGYILGMIQAFVSVFATAVGFFAWMLWA